MGNNGSHRKNGQLTKAFVSELSSFYQYQQECGEEEYVEYFDCCGIQYTKVLKRKIMWETNFVKNCQMIKNEFKWVSELNDLVRNNLQSKAKYFKEVHILRNQLRISDANQRDVLISPAEAQNFKTNLKKSVLISFSQTSKFFQDTSSNRISSSISTMRKSRIDIDRYNEDGFRGSILRRTDRSPSVYSNKSNSKNGLRKSIMSFVDDTLSSIFGNDKQISKQTAKDLQLFLKFSMILEKHLNDNNCMLTRVKKMFIASIQRTYVDSNWTSKHIAELIDDIKQFLMLFREAIIDYYHLGVFSEGQFMNAYISNQQNILSLCTTILFKDSIFYNIVFNAATVLNREREERFNKIISHLGQCSPQKFLVKQKFCLNRQTIKSYLRQLNDDSRKSMAASFQFDEKTIDANQPYKGCMIVLKQLEKSRTPINKMKIIMSCSEGMTKQIEAFYDINCLKRDKWLLDADQVLSIYCYILIGAKVEHLHSHLFILDNFSTSSQMISITGYYLSVMNCAVEQIENDFGKQLDTAQDEL